jgi:hypothetical protein
MILRSQHLIKILKKLTVLGKGWGREVAGWSRPPLSQFVRRANFYFLCIWHWSLENLQGMIIRAQAPSERRLRASAGSERAQAPSERANRIFFSPSSLVGGKYWKCDDGLIARKTISDFGKKVAPSRQNMLKALQAYGLQTQISNPVLDFIVTTMHTR